MNGVMGMTELLLHGQLNEEQRQYAEVARESGKTLLALLDDILDLSRIEAGKLELNNKSFHLHEFLKDSVEVHALRARAKGLRFNFSPDPRLPERVIGDTRRLGQILTNLLGNAIKFTEKGEIGLHAQLGDGDTPEGFKRILFTVRDTGIGIREEAKGRLFERFSQADGSITRAHGGTGLGLAISRKLTEMMGGNISVESAPGEGSVFSFTVLLREAAVRAGHPVAERNSGMATRRSAANQRGAPTPKKDAEQAAPARAPRFHGKVLVVEDNRVNQMVARTMLARFGVRPRVAADALEALAAYDEDLPDLIFMDVQMPGMDGVEATKAIRGREADAGVENRVTIVGMTAHAMQGDRERFLAAGMDDYVPKPVQLNAFEAVLSRSLQLVKDGGDGTTR